MLSIPKCKNISSKSHPDGGTNEWMKKRGWCVTKWLLPSQTIGAALLSNHIIVGLRDLTIEPKHSDIFMDEITRTTPKPYHLNEITILDYTCPYLDEKLSDHPHVGFITSINVAMLAFLEI